MNIKEYLISIVIICILIIVFELFISEGSTKKYVTGVVKLILIIALLSPLRIIFNNEYSTDCLNLIQTETNQRVETDEKFIEYTSNARIENLIYEIESDLELNGIDATVEIETYNSNIKKILVKLEYNSINENIENIFTNEKIIKIIQENVYVDGEKIYIYD